MPYSSFREEELLTRIKWFIQLRWIFLTGLILTVLIANKIFQVELPFSKIFLVAGVIFLYNLGFYIFHIFFSSLLSGNLKLMRIEANFQISLDLVALTFLLHFSGGIENPFIFFYLFHAIIGSILLSRKEVWAQSILGIGLFFILTTLEYFQIIPHYHLKGFFPVEIHRNPLYVSVVCVVLAGVIFAIIYIASTIVQSLRERERELFLTKNMLQKKSEDLEATNLKLIEKQKQLVQSEKLASLGQLVSGIAHEINNPVQFILGNMSIVKEAFESLLPILDVYYQREPNFTIARLKYPFFKEHIQTLIQDMARGGERIRDIIKDLKAFARTDEERMDEEVDLNEVVQICVRLVHNKVKHYQLEMELEEDLPKLKGNERKLEQVVIVNLINAAEALVGRNNGRIKISTSSVNNGQEVVLAISDNGPGMEEVVKERIFDPFFTTKQRTGGTGLGLSVTYGIIKEHNGYIEIESELGKGATFIYHLPVDRSAG